MKTSLEIISEKIKDKSPSHAAKLEANLAGLGHDYRHAANAFFGQYRNHLEKSGIGLDFGIDCYLHMIDDMLGERMQFIRSGNYSNTSFDAVEKSVYGNPEIMTYHMHGLVLAQFLWFDQYERILFFAENLRRYVPKMGTYLEIGGGHGLYLNEALNRIPEMERFDMVDISQSSLDLAKGIVDSQRVNYYLRNIFDFTDSETYDFVTLGEVLEHVENPLELLQKIAGLLSQDGVCYLTTPVNAPMIDHIYLFNNTDEIRTLLDEAGFEIIAEKVVISEKIPAEKAAKFKVPVMFAAFIKKKK